MENLFVSYEHAIGLKELGFDEPCLKYWNGIGEYFDQNDWFNWNQSEKFISIPLKQQVFKWFRDEYNLLGIVSYCDDNSGKFMSVIDKINSDIDYDMNAKDTYEEAEDACLDRLIKITKDKK
jgi:hypothetical protein